MSYDTIRSFKTFQLDRSTKNRMNYVLWNDSARK